MTEEQEDIPAAVSESVDVESQDNQVEPTMVPLAALQAERKKRQELETRNRVYEDIMARKQEAKEPEEPEDPEALLTKGGYQEEKAMTKREILEQVYQDMNPKAVHEINQFLKPILDKKPWLAASVDSAVNRLSRAKEIVDDYRHLVDDSAIRRTGAQDAQRIMSNAQKPGSPVALGKSAQPSGIEYLKSIQGKAEFREYRQKMLKG